MQHVGLFLSSLLLLAVACSSESELDADDDRAIGEDAGTSSSSSGDAGNDARREPTEQQRAQADELAAMVQFFRDNTAYPFPLDYPAITQRGRDSILGGDGSDDAFLGALYRAFREIPQGHQGFGLAEGCGTRLPYQGYTRRGVCGRPHPRGVVVTAAHEANPLGLRQGDVVRAVDGDGDVLEHLGERPMCTGSMPSAASVSGYVAATFADLLTAGETLQIESPDGQTRDVVVNDSMLDSFFSCIDPLGRATDQAVYAERRDDGIAVIRLPGFTDPEQPFPEDPDDIAAYRETFEAKIQAAFDTVADAPGIVWDIRGNGGGLTMVGLDIASGFPGADGAPISYCVQRTPNSDPPAFAGPRYAEYALTPGGRFAYAGKVAVLTDQLNYSAADYFPLASKLRTSAIVVGAPTSGAFGASSLNQAFAGPPAFRVTVDVNRCAAATTDEPLETHAVVPREVVDYDPADLAAGRDTLLERAASLLSNAP